MKDFKKLHFASAGEFRSWLNSNHNHCPGIWLIYYKKHTGKKSIRYDEAVEEALCFGWIDSTIKRIDDERYMQKFTPRTNIENWSDTNKKRVLKLINEGRMKEAGLNKIGEYRRSGKINWKETENVQKQDDGLVIPCFIIAELAKNEPALANFNNMAPSHKRNYVRWITEAKKEETIQKRLKEATILLKNDHKNLMK